MLDTLELRLLTFHFCVSFRGPGLSLRTGHPTSCRVGYFYPGHIVRSQVHRGFGFSRFIHFSSLTARTLIDTMKIARN